MINIEAEACACVNGKLQWGGKCQLEDSSGWQCQREVAWLHAELCGNASSWKQVNIWLKHKWVIQKKSLSVASVGL